MRAVRPRSPVDVLLGWRDWFGFSIRGSGDAADRPWSFDATPSFAICLRPAGVPAIVKVASRMCGGCASHHARAKVRKHKTGAAIVDRAGLSHATQFSQGMAIGWPRSVAESNAGGA